MATLVSPVIAPAQRSARLWRFRVPAGLVALVMGLTGGHNLVIGWTDPLDGGIHRLQDLHWGVMEGLFVAVALALQLRRPARHPGAMRVALLALAGQLVVAVATVAPDPFGITVLVLVLLATAAHPARHEVLRPALTVDPRRLALAVPAACALAVYAAVQVAHQWQAAPHDLLVAKTGYVGAAASMVGLALLLLTSALTRSRAATSFAALGMVVLGLASVLHPHLASSFGTAGGSLALLTGAMLAGQAARDLRATSRAD